MAAENMMVCSDSDILRNSNTVMELVVEDLCSEGLISEEVRDEYLSTRVVIAYRPSWFGNVWRKLQGKKEEKDKLILTVADIGEYKEEG